MTHEGLYLDEEVSGHRVWDGTPEGVRRWTELYFWMERCKWRSWALQGLEIVNEIPTDGVTAIRSQVWERMDAEPQPYEREFRELIHIARDHMEGSRGIMERQELEIRLARYWLDTCW